MGETTYKASRRCWALTFRNGHPRFGTQQVMSRKSRLKMSLTYLRNIKKIGSTWGFMLSNESRQGLERPCSLCRSSLWPYLASSYLPLRPNANVITFCDSAKQSGNSSQGIFLYLLPEHPSYCPKLVYNISLILQLEMRYLRMYTMSFLFFFSPYHPRSLVQLSSYRRNLINISR